MFVTQTELLEQVLFDRVGNGANFSFSLLFEVLKSNLDNFGGCAITCEVIWLSCEQRLSVDVHKSTQRFGIFGQFAFGLEHSWILHDR